VLDGFLEDNKEVVASGDVWHGYEQFLIGVSGVRVYICRIRPVLRKTGDLDDVKALGNL
jgi:hypothetical protein